MADKSMLVTPDSQCRLASHNTRATSRFSEIAVRMRESGTSGTSLWNVCLEDAEMKPGFESSISLFREAEHEGAVTSLTRDG